MKYSTVALALSLALAGGIASADDADPTAPAPANPAPANPYGGTSYGGATSAAPKGGATTSAQTQIPPVDLLFDTDSTNLKASARHDLEALATWAKCTPNGAVILEGHADPRGTQQHNMELAGQRVGVVRQKLVDMGVPSDRIIVTIYGENGPQRESLAQSRRVTVRATSRPVQAGSISAQR